MPWPSEVFLLDEDSLAALKKRAGRITQICSKYQITKFADFAFSVNSDFGARKLYLAIVASSFQDLEKKLQQSISRLSDQKCREINDRNGIYYNSKPLAKEGRVAFLFPGEGSQYPHMLSNLCISFPEIRKCFDMLDNALYAESIGPLPSQFIFPPLTNASASGSLNNHLWQMDGAIEAVFAANLALLTLLDRLQVAPDVVFGHSTGEYNALLAAGAISVRNREHLVRYLREGDKVSKRIIAENKIWSGELLAVGPADQQIIAPLLKRREGSLWMALDNCPNQQVLFGREQVIEEVISELRPAGIICQKLPFSRPYHTPLFAPVSDELEKFFSTFDFCSPRVEVYSCATGRPYPSDQEQIRQLLLEQWTLPVRFREGIEHMYGADVRVFVEVGPCGNLSTFVKDTLIKRRHTAIPLNVLHKSDVTQLNHAVARLAAHGVPICLDYLYTERGARRVELDINPPTPLGSARLKLSLALPIMVAPQIIKEEQRAAPSRSLSSCSESLTAPGDVCTSTEGNASVNVSTLNSASTSAPRSAVMAEYLRTMQRFLEVQEESLMVFFDQAGGVPALVQKPDQFALKNECRPRHTSSPHVQQHAVGVVAKDDEVISSPQSYRVPDAQQSAVYLGDILLAIVTEKTGYPRDMLNLDASLEGDLGLDSLKRMEILGALQRQTRFLSAGELETASRCTTLQQILDTFLQASASGNTKPLSNSGILPEETEVSEANQDGGNVSPFAGKVVSLSPGKEVRTTNMIDLDEMAFLEDHALGAKVSASDPELRAFIVMPLTVSLECLAQTASILVPGKPLCVLRDVRAYRWIGLGGGKVTVEIVAQVNPDSPLEIKAKLTEHVEKRPSMPAVEATCVFGHPEMPRAALPFDLTDARPVRWTPEQLYSDVMFHGPAFRGVMDVDWSGEDSIQAKLRVPDEHNLFHLPAMPGFLTSPLLLDTVGQMIGFWTADRLTAGYVVFPFQVERIDLYSPLPKAGEQFIGRARIVRIDDTQVAADMEIVDSDNMVRTKVTNWVDKRTDLPDAFFRMRMAPKTTLISDSWPQVLAHLPTGHGLSCFRFEPDESWFLVDGRIWRVVLAHLVLNRRERETWQKLEFDKRSTQWLLGRTVAKDAIRAFIRAATGIALYPADIEIVPDDYGQPFAVGTEMEATGVRPRISIAHSAGIGVALVGNFSNYHGLGIDVECLDRPHHGVEQILLSEDETLAAARSDICLDDEWMLRLWCAKEAVAKAFGRGLAGSPRNLMLRSIEPISGTVHIELSGDLAAAFPAAAGRTISAFTGKDENKVIAISWRGVHERDNTGSSVPGPSGHDPRLGVGTHGTPE